MSNYYQSTRAPGINLTRNGDCGCVCAGAGHRFEAHVSLKGREVTVKTSNLVHLNVCVCVLPKVKYKIKYLCCRT
jgi:hypothetical protein